MNVLQCSKEAWMRRHGVVTFHTSEAVAGQSDENGGPILPAMFFPWIAVLAERANDLAVWPSPANNDIGVGYTEHEALADLALKQGWPMCPPR